MADVEEEGEFGSHFLDSMLEIEMTEVDGEVDILKNESPHIENSRVLPPIPTFDLQSQTLLYRNTYRNSLGHPRLPNPPVVTSTVPKVFPLVSSVPVLKPSPMLTIYSKNLLPPQNSPVVTKSNPSVQKFCSKSNIKNPLKIHKSTAVSEQMVRTKFLKQVFRAEYIKNVFIKKDEPSDISQFGKEEMEFYKTCFKDVSKVKYFRLHCTICDKHLGCSVNVEKKLMVHKMLKVMTCKPCSEFYGDGNFPCDTGDNCEIYCRWCGQGGALVCCSFCPRVFCKKCVRRNFGASFLRSIQRASDWACFCCAQRPLWPHRAICRALIEYIHQRKTDPKLSQRDMTTCCDGSILNKKKIKPIDKTKILLAQGQIKINPVAKSTVLPLDQKNQIIVPTKPVSGKEQSILKSNIQVKSDQNRGSHGSIKVLNKNLKPSISNMLQTKSLLTGNNILQNLTLNPSKKIASSLLPTQLIQSPVLHGETLITPPSSRMMVSTKTSNNAGSSCVKVSFTNQTSNLDMSKIPSAKIPHDVQELILRITFPDNKVQFVRLVADGNKCKGAKAFPMPQFNSGGNNGFVEDNLEDSFRLSKMIFDKLSKIKERISSRTKFTEESVFISSANKLHFIYEKSIELLKELDKSLLANFDKWKAETKSTLDVIDLSDEESKSSSGRTLKKLQKSSKFIEKCKEFFPSDDSDIEILDAPEVSYKINKHKSNFRKVMKGQTLNGCSQAYGANFKDKYRFRNLPADNLKPHKKVRNIPAKRKRVGKRKGKRLKPENTNGEKKEEKIEWVSSKSNDESVASLMPNTINSNSVV